MTILVTGATGFLGGATAARLAEQGRLADLSFLVRAPNERQGVERLRASLVRFGLPPEMLYRIDERQVVLGDLADVAAFAGHPSLDTASHVVNCAAVASFGSHPGIWPVNVTGTLEFARRMARVAGLQRFLHVGTAMACGPGQTSPVVESDEFPPLDQHLVKYTASKAEVERLMRAELPSLPLVVARPSIVIGHTTLGCGPSSSIFWVFRMGQDLAHFMCEPTTFIDVVPVDWCAGALSHLLLRNVLRWDLYHLSAGARSENFSQIEGAMARVRGIPPVTAQFRRVTKAELRALLPTFQEKLGIRNRALILRAMALYGGFSELGYRFDNARLAAEGWPLPPRFTDYVARCVETTEHVPLIEQMADDFK